MFGTEWVLTDQQYKEVGFSGGTVAENLPANAGDARDVGPV